MSGLAQARGLDEISAFGFTRLYSGSASMAVDWGGAGDRRRCCRFGGPFVARNRARNQRLLFPSVEHCVGRAGRFSTFAMGYAGDPRSRWTPGWVHGALRIGQDSRPRKPEAIEAILLRGARVDPKVALLKPISAAIAIGSGGPFGAEGPIIMTGGAFGSLVAQWLNLTDAERTTLLVAGAAAGMSATFAAPIAAILLAVELLLFEWRPRSLVPVAVAST